jgi:single-stranded DNA-binding protein
MGANKVLLVGEVSQYGVKLRYSEHGQPEASFTLIVREPSKTDEEYKLFVPVLIYGVRAEGVAADVEGGDVCLVDGKLAWRSSEKRSGQKEGKLVVMGWNVTVLTRALASVGVASDN